MRPPQDHQRLLILSRSVVLNPAFGRAVFWFEDEGRRLSQEFIDRNPGYTRLDELLAQSTQGKVLLRELTALGRPWNQVEGVWWDLSDRLARAARGVVHVFGPQRLIMDVPVEAHRHKYATHNFAHTIFEKIEFDTLGENPNVTKVWYNGRSLD